MVTVLSILFASARAEPPKQVDASTLNGKMIFGYQGWFACPGDTAGRGWVHWMNAQHMPTVDLLPDVSELDPDELCDSGWKTADGKPIYLFSSQNPKTVDRHFAWMEQYGLDGVAVERFATQLLTQDIKSTSDVVVKNARAGAEHHGRVFFLMYDLSGMPPDQIMRVDEDWDSWLKAGLIKSPSYLRHNGKPVLGLWGLGFAGRNLSAEVVSDLIVKLKAHEPGLTVIGGVPAGWREGQLDASPDPAWKSVWPKLDVISPWTVGRYVDEAGADNYAAALLKPDLAFARALHVDYMPVAFPGFAWANLRFARNEPSHSIFNQIPRQCGAFYWRQVYDDVHAGVGMMYTAMFDEVDEGTAMFKAVPGVQGMPVNPRFLPLDADGCQIPSDWYLRLATAATAAVASGGVLSAMPLRSH